MSCVATYTVVKRAAGDDPDRDRDRAAEIVNADRDHATDDRDPRIVGSETTKVGTVDLEDTNCRELCLYEYSFRIY